MITDNKKFIEIQGILSLSNISSNDCIKINNLIIELSKENQELKEKTKLFHKNGVFSLEYDKETLRDMVLEYQEKIDKALEKINDYKIYCKKNKGFTEYTDIEKEIKVDRISVDLQEPLQMPIKLTPEMLEEQIRKKLINKSLEIGIDLGNGYSKQSYFKR